MKKIIIFIIIILVFAGGFILFSKKGGTTRPPQAPTQAPQPTTAPTSPPIPEIKQATGDTLYYDGLPFYPDITEIDRYLTEGDGVCASYETKVGVTPKEVLDYYEKELKKQGWQITLRDRDDGQLQALSIDEVQLRIWVFFTGAEDEGVVFNVDFRIPGSEAWLPIPIQ